MIEPTEDKQFDELDDTETSEDSYQFIPERDMTKEEKRSLRNMADADLTRLSNWAEDRKIELPDTEFLTTLIILLPDEAQNFLPQDMYEKLSTILESILQKPSLSRYDRDDCKQLQKLLVRYFPQQQILMKSREKLLPEFQQQLQIAQAEGKWIDYIFAALDIVECFPDLLPEIRNMLEKPEVISQIQSYLQNEREVVRTNFITRLTPLIPEQTRQMRGYQEAVTSLKQALVENRANDYSDLGSTLFLALITSGGEEYTSHGWRLLPNFSQYQKEDTPPDAFF